MRPRSTSALTDVVRRLTEYPLTQRQNGPDGRGGIGNVFPLLIAADLAVIHIAAEVREKDIGESSTGQSYLHGRVLAKTVLSPGRDANRAIAADSRASNKL